MGIANNAADENDLAKFIGRGRIAAQSYTRPHASESRPSREKLEQLAVGGRNNHDEEGAYNSVQDLARARLQQDREKVSYQGQDRLEQGRQQGEKTTADDADNEDEENNESSGCNSSAVNGDNNINDEDDAQVKPATTTTKEEKHQQFEVRWEGDDDPSNPVNMKRAKKWTIVLIVSAGSACVYVLPCPPLHLDSPSSTLSPLPFPFLPPRSLLFFSIPF